MMPFTLHSGIARAVVGGRDGDLAELNALRARVAELEGLIGARAAEFFPLRLRPQARIILGLLIARERVTTAALMTALYAGRPECEWPDDPAAVIKQQIFYLRKVIAPLGLGFVTHDDVPGEPFYVMDAASRQTARALMARRQGRPLS